MSRELDRRRVANGSGRGRLLPRVAALMLLALAVAAPAVAQRELFPSFSVVAGAYVLSNDTTVGLRGQRVNLEDDFDLAGDETLATVRLEWQPGQRHLFRLGYYRLSLDGSRTIDRNITWGGVTYPAGASVSAELEQTVYEADWTWWLVKRERGAFGTALGATVLEFDARADAELRLGNNTLNFHQDASVTAPVPTIGLAGRVQPLSQLWLDAEARVLPGVKFDNIEGDALYLSASAEWQALSHLNVGINWSSFTIDAVVEDSNFNGDLDFTNEGFQAYVRFVF